MKTVISIFLISVFGALKAQAFEFKLNHCESSSLIFLKEKNLHFENLMLEPIIYDKLISDSDFEILNTQFDKIFKKRHDEVWLNHCIDDGTNLKFHLSKNGFTKKVFVGNYFDERLNVIALVLNKYILEIETPYIVTIPYGTSNKGNIKEQIKRQRKCKDAPEEYKERMLNVWCEPYK